MEVALLGIGVKDNALTGWQRGRIIQYCTIGEGSRHNSTNIKRLLALCLSGRCAEITQRTDNGVLHFQNYGRRFKLVRNQQPGITPRTYNFRRSRIRYSLVLRNHDLLPSSCLTSGQFQRKLRIDDNLASDLRYRFVDFTA